MKKTISKKDFEHLPDSWTGLVVFIIRSIIPTLEETARTDEDPDIKDILAATQGADKMIREMAEEVDFFDECYDVDLLLKIYDALPFQNQKAVIYSLGTFSDLLDESLEHSVGKHRKKQLDLYTETIDIMKYIAWANDNDVPPSVYWEVLEKGLNYIEKLYDHDSSEESPGTSACAIDRMALIKDFRSKLDASNRKKSYEGPLFELCDAMSDEEKDFFVLKALADIEDYFMYELDAVEEEYADLDMDFSKYNNRIAAIVQIGRKLRQRYKKLFNSLNKA